MARIEIPGLDTTATGIYRESQQIYDGGFGIRTDQIGNAFLSPTADNSECELSPQCLVLDKPGNSGQKFVLLEGGSFDSSKSDFFSSPSALVYSNVGAAILSKPSPEHHFLSANGLGTVHSTKQASAHIPFNSRSQILRGIPDPTKMTFVSHGEGGKPEELTGAMYSANVVQRDRQTKCPTLFSFKHPVDGIETYTFIEMSDVSKF